MEQPMPEPELSDGKCRAITKKGTPCKNRATENGYCRIHGKEDNPQRNVIHGKEDNPQRNVFAITGLSLGIASIILFEVGIIPLLAVVFSGIGLAKAGERGGKWKAWVGLILGILYYLSNMYHNGHLQ